MMKFPLGFPYGWLLPEGAHQAAAASVRQNRLTKPNLLPPLPGNGGGFFYLSSNGEVLSVPSPSGFDERYVLLDDASFFEVSGPLGASQGGGDGGEEVAARFREIFRKKAGILRIAYTSAVGPRSVEAICRQVRRRE